MTVLTLYPPAKINLSLRVLGKREDGFHALDTLMLPIGLTDVLSFTRSERFSFSCDMPDVPVDESNLVVRAVRLFEKEIGREVRFHIHLEKRIPHGAGLGGGSSDAAFTLKGLDSLLGAELGLDRLSILGAELGSDVPFFLYETLCRCTGRGEIIEPLAPIPPSPLLLVKPSFGVPTPDAYKRWASSRELENVDYSPRKWRGLDISNDLERPVFEKYLFLSSLKMWLLEREEAEVALMSGSGSTLFVLCHSLEKGKILAKKVKSISDDLWVWNGATR